MRHLRGKGSPARLVLFALAGALLLAACGGRAGAGAGPTVPPATSDSASASPSTDPSASPSAASGSSSATRCHTTELQALLKPGGGGAGHAGLILVLTNTGQRSCDVYGYVGMRLLASGASPMPTTVKRGGGYLFSDPGPALVKLAPGQAASAGVEWSTVPGPGDPTTGCPMSAALEITPPDETAHLVVSRAIGACQQGTLQTTALQPGVNGPR